MRNATFLLFCLAIAVCGGMVVQSATEGGLPSTVLSSLTLAMMIVSFFSHRVACLRRKE